MDATSGARAGGDVRLRKKDTGEPGNGGQFGTGSRPGSGLTLLSEPVISAETVDVFTLRHCGELAHELHERTGWPVVVVTDGCLDVEGRQGWVHAAVRAPDGRILDVEGWHDEGDWLDCWGESADVLGVDVEDYDGDEVVVIGAEEMYGSARLDLGDESDPEVVALAGRTAGVLLRHVPATPAHDGHVSSQARQPAGGEFNAPSRTDAGVDRDDRVRYETRSDAIEREIVAAIEGSGEVDDARAEFDLDAIAEEVLADHGGGYSMGVDEDGFWDAVQRNVR